MDMQIEAMPMLSVPVERSLNTTAAAQAEGVDQSYISNSVPWMDFADEGDE
jgi:hypothetical protein